MADMSEWPVGGRQRTGGAGAREGGPFCRCSRRAPRNGLLHAVLIEITAVLAEFDEQMRRHPPAEPGARTEADAHVTRVLAEGTGWNGVVWSDLGNSDADETITAQIERFSVLGQPWEWKYYSYDRPADLPDRLRRAGFMPDEVEAVLVAEVAALAMGTVLPAGVELVPVVDQAGVDALVQVHDESSAATIVPSVRPSLPALAPSPHRLRRSSPWLGDAPSPRDELSSRTALTLPRSGVAARCQPGGVGECSARWSLTALRWLFSVATVTCRSTPLPKAGLSCCGSGLSNSPRPPPFRYGSPKHAPAP